MHVVCTRVCVLMCVLMCVAKSSPVIPCASSGPGSIVACFRMVFHSLGLPSTDIHSTSLKDDRILHCPFGTSPCNKSSCIQCICWTLFFHVFFNEYFPHSSEYWRGGYCNCSRVSHVCFSFTVFLVVHEWAVPGPAGVKCLLLWCGLYWNWLCSVDSNTCSCKGRGRWDSFPTFTTHHRGSLPWSYVLCKHKWDPCSQ